MHKQTLAADMRDSIACEVNEGFSYCCKELVCGKLLHSACELAKNCEHVSLQ
jgi:hypothetical protein